MNIKFIVAGVLYFSIFVCVYFLIFFHRQELCLFRQRVSSTSSFVFQAGELTFASIARQPIGQRLLKLFFEAQGGPPPLLLAFVNSVQKYAELIPGDFQRDSARQLVDTYVKKGNIQCLRQ